MVFEVCWLLLEGAVDVGVDHPLGPDVDHDLRSSNSTSTLPTLTLLASTPNWTASRGMSAVSTIEACSMFGLELAVSSLYRVDCLHSTMCTPVPEYEYLTASTPGLARLPAPKSQLLAHCHLNSTPAQPNNRPSPPSVIPAGAFNPTHHFPRIFRTQPPTGEAVTPTRIDWALVITMPSHIVARQ